MSRVLSEVWRTFQRAFEMHEGRRALVRCLSTRRAHDAPTLLEKHACGAPIHHRPTDAGNVTVLLSLSTTCIPIQPSSVPEVAIHGRVLREVESGNKSMPQSVSTQRGQCEGFVESVPLAVAVDSRIQIGFCCLPRGAQSFRKIPGTRTQR